MKILSTFKWPNGGVTEKLVNMQDARARTKLAINIREALRRGAEITTKKVEENSNAAQ